MAASPADYIILDLANVDTELTNFGPLFTSEKETLYLFCKNILVSKIVVGTPDKSAFQIFLEMYNAHIKMPNPGMEINPVILERELNLFLNYLKIYNSSYGRPQNTVEEETKYAENLLTIVRIKDNLHLSEKFEINDIRISLLFKFVNQKAYEKTSQYFFNRKGYPRKEKFRYTHLNFVNEARKNRDYEIKNVLASSIFEEIVLWVISGGIDGLKPICSIHSPKSGDILMLDGTSVEVKSTIDKPKAIRQFDVSYRKKPHSVTLSYGIHGGDCAYEVGKVNVCLHAYNLPIVPGDSGFNITKDFLQVESIFDSALKFAISKSEIETLTAIPNVRDLLKDFYSTIVRYNTPSSSSGKVRLHSKTRGGPSALVPKFMPSLQSMVSSTAKTQKLGKARTASSTAKTQKLGMARTVTKTSMGSAASKTKKASTAPIFEGVVESCCTKTGSGSSQGEIKRNDNEYIIPFTGTFEVGTKVKFKIRSSINRAYDVKILPGVQGKNKKSKKFKRRKSKKEKTKKK